MELSEDQARARERIARMLAEAGVDLDAAGARSPRAGDPGRRWRSSARPGRARPCCWRSWCASWSPPRVEPISTDYESRRTRGRRTLAVLAPTNKAASVLRGRGVAATTIHRILYTPLYKPEYEKLAEWLAGRGPRPVVEGLSDAALDRAAAFFAAHQSIPGALASAGLRGADFIKGWKRRDDPLDIGFVDEASMLDDKAIADLESAVRDAGAVR